jgi:hypothetical protein
MQIITVRCNESTNESNLSIGDKILVKYKPLDKEGEEMPEIQKEITIAKFKPYEDESEQVWIVDQDGEVFAEENFVKVITD